MTLEPYDPAEPRDPRQPHLLRAAVLSDRLHRMTAEIRAYVDRPESLVRAYDDAMQAAIDLFDELDRCLVGPARLRVEQSRKAFITQREARRRNETRRQAEIALREAGKAPVDREPGATQAPPPKRRKSA